MKIMFNNTRFDPDLIEFHAIAKDMAKSVGYTAGLTVEKQLAQLLRLRVAQINPCSYCLILHTKAAQDQDISDARISNLLSWRESTLYSEPEQASLNYCEALTLFEMPNFQDAHELMKLHFNETQIAEVAAIVINMNLWTRLKMAQGAIPILEE